MKTRRGFLVGGLVLAVAFGALLFAAFRTFGSYSLTVTDFLSRQAALGMSVTEFAGAQGAPGDREVEVHGWVNDGAPAGAGGAGSRRLTITDGSATVPVSYKDGPAGILVPGTEVIVRGKGGGGSLQEARVMTTKEVRIEGPLSPDVEVFYDVSTRTTRFSITDTKDVKGPKQSLAVTYTGAVPDTFFIDVKRVDVSMVAIGRMGPDGIFVASQILTKCASRYEAATPVPQ